MPRWSTGRWDCALVVWRNKYLNELCIFTGKSVDKILFVKALDKIKSTNIVYLIQDMCKMATEAITSGQTSVKAELRRTANTRKYLQFISFLSTKKNKTGYSVVSQLTHPCFSCSAATRMIANALSNDSPPATPVRRPDNRLSVTVSNTQQHKSTKAGR